MPYCECFISHYKALWRLLNYISCKDIAILAFSANLRIEAAKALMPERMVRAIMSKGIRLGEILKPTG
jgi:hypothetical protein